MKVEDIKVIQIGPTTKCNGICKYCVRNLQKVPSIDIDPVIFDKLPIETIDRVFFSGIAGDPIFYKPLFDVIEKITKLNENLKISIATNGSIHSDVWWEYLAHLMSDHPKNHVYFALDGLEDTHHIYRGINYNKVLRNMKSFIKGGGNAIWQFIVFKYNEHQIKEAEKIANDIGCLFIQKMSRKYEETGDFAKPSNVKYNSREEMCNTLSDPICCFYIDRKEIWVEADNSVHPCCFLSSKFFFKTPDLSNLFKDKLMFNYYRSRKILNLLEHSLKEILNSSYFEYTNENFEEMDVCKKHCKMFWYRPYMTSDKGLEKRLKLERGK